MSKISNVSLATEAEMGVGTPRNIGKGTEFFIDPTGGIYTLKAILADGSVVVFSDNQSINGMNFQGNVDLSTNLFPTVGGSGPAGAIEQGDFFVVTVGGTMCGVDVEVGDAIIANVDLPAQVCANWTILEKAFNPAPAASPAYGRAVGTNDAVIGADADVVFNINSYTLPNTGFGVAGFMPNASAGFTIQTAGDYEYDFSVAGSHASAATTSLEFAIYVNGAIAAVGGPVNEFRSNQQAGATDIQVVNGHGWLALNAGDVVTLHNRTNTVTDAVDVTSIPPGGEAGVNRTMTLKKIS